MSYRPSSNLPSRARATHAVEARSVRIDDDAPEDESGPLVMLDAAALAKLVEDAVRRATAHLVPPRVPAERAYSLAELGYRLRLGTDPALVTADVVARTSPVSRQVIDRLIGAPTGIGAELLARRVGGRWYVTEGSVQNWEARCEALGEKRRLGRVNGTTALKTRPRGSAKGAGVPGGATKA